MYSFMNDYSEGAHPRILNALLETNLEQTQGYGEDIYCQKAAELIRQRIGRTDLAIHFLSGGTQTNLTALSAFLRPYEAAIAADTGHILVHETGAIEATGHKVISIPGSDGKINPQRIQVALEIHKDEHMVKPKLVYISNPTEIGTIYHKSELEELSRFCNKNNLYLYIDGARLGSALCSPENDLSLADLGVLADAFYIGGTKNGALLGEALVISNDALKEDFRFHLKQKGAMLAKGRVLGIQFLELFKDDLYFDLAKHANTMADRLQNAFCNQGFQLLTHSATNQIFPILPDSLIGKMQKKYSFSVWSKIDQTHSVVRFVTSWATPEEAVINFIEDLKNLTK
ncbi:MAG TPA: threonine aldolase [Firmicutes bacterium]|jgi:threonine aldolase|nr:threonine aldolase [Bacillota bacterium]